MPNYAMHYDSAGHPPDASSPLASDDLPRRFVLHQNYPNPFNGSTTIQFDLTRPSKVVLKIFNVLGQEVGELVNERIPAGSHRISWTATNLPSGIYLCRMETEGFSQVRKLLLLR